MTTAERLSLEQFLGQPDTEPASEYVCGEVIQKPMPGMPHSLIQKFLLLVLEPFLQASRLGLTFSELGCVFGPAGEERAPVPDIAFIAMARLPRGDSRAVDHFHGAPDLAVEILSPGQPMGRFAEKIWFYLQFRVRLVWIIDPEAETVTTVSPEERGLTLARRDVLDGGDVLPGFTLQIDQIFDAMQL